MLVIFDVIGTLFSLNRVKDRFRERGVRQELADLWFAKITQSAMAATLANKYIPFSLIAHSTLKQLFLREQIPEPHLDELAASLREIEPYGDARGCLRSLREDGHQLVAVSNGSYGDTERLLERSGLGLELHRFYSADMVKACKPHPAVYDLVFRTMFIGPYDCCMVAAHGWDILGGQSRGMATVYVNRLEQAWPVPGSPEGFVVNNLRDVPFAIASQRETGNLKEAA
jgi:2-haloacid dehalogenase